MEHMHSLSHSLSYYLSNKKKKTYKIYTYVCINKTPKACFMKEDIDKWDFIRIKNICSVKDNSKSTRRQPQTGRKHL